MHKIDISLKSFILIALGTLGTGVPLEIFQQSGNNDCEIMALNIFSKGATITLAQSFTKKLGTLSCPDVNLFGSFLIAVSTSVSVISEILIQLTEISVFLSDSMKLEGL